MVLVLNVSCIFAQNMRKNVADNQNVTKRNETDVSDEESHGEGTSQYHCSEQINSTNSSVFYVDSSSFV